ncbi:proteasome subunit alpha type-2-like isoform X1 [Rhodnius prolixus]|uniref:proteasome subunit alpha type-2-like isoform X1 n=1 Tax=Rhodnius prolixus TaxID=13249 RepID=UPI003D18F894
MASFSNLPSLVVRRFGVSLLFCRWNDQLIYGKNGTYDSRAENGLIVQEYIQSGYSETLEINDAVHPVNQKLKEGFTGQMAADDVEVGFCDEAEFGALDQITKRLPREHTLREV